LISVIIPVFNAESFLEESVNSVLVHSCVKELILVEDGSSDSSLAICQWFQSIDPRIRILTHEGGRNRGAAESRNLGIRKVRFPYVAFLDSDDRYFDNRFSIAIDMMENNLSLDGCYGKVVICHENENRNKLMGPPVNLVSDRLFTFLLNGGYFHTNSITVRTSFLKKIGFFDPRCWPHEDVELWMRMAFEGRLVSVPIETPLAIYRIHGENLSKVANWKSKWILWSTVFCKYFFKEITWCNRFYIIKQLIKVGKWDFNTFYKKCRSRIFKSKIFPNAID